MVQAAPARRLSSQGSRSSAKPAVAASAAALHVQVPLRIRPTCLVRRMRLGQQLLLVMQSWCLRMRSTAWAVTCC